MSGPLFELLWRSFRGALVQRARRLRRPRYLVAFLLSAAYFGFLVLPNLLRARVPTGSALDNALGPAVLIGSFIGALVLAFLVTALWIFASSKPALQLGEADIDLLLPAPLSRRKIIELSLWRQQAGLLFGALFVNVLRGAGPPAVRLERIFITWALLLLASLHAKGVSLWKARLRELPAAAARRRIGLAIAAAVVFWGGVAAGLRGAMADAARGAAGAPLLAPRVLHDLLLRLATSPPLLLAIFLAPFRWLVGALLASVVRLHAVLPAAGLPGLSWPAGAAAIFLAALVAAHYEWVVRSRARFEEATIERARRMAERRVRKPALPAPAARARRQAPFRLAPAGAAEVAIYWKNLLLGSRTPLRRRAALALLPGLLAWAALTAAGAPLAAVTSVAGCGCGLLVLLPLVGGLSQRQDIRTDLLHFEVLRAWPLRGWRLVAAEILAPATNVLAWLVSAWGLLLGAALAAGARLGHDDLLHGTLQADRWQHAAGRGGSALGAVAAISIALLFAAAAVSLLSIAVQNVAALALPGWVTLGVERRVSSGLTGQRMLMLIGLLLALLVALVPGALLAAGAVAAGAWMGLAPAPWQAPLLALLVCLPVLAEVGLLVRLGGALWDRLDPAEEILAPPA